jgi:hypothetical protein
VYSGLDFDEVVDLLEKEDGRSGPILGEQLLELVI